MDREQVNMDVNIECLRYFAKVIEAETGIFYSEANFYQLSPRIVELAKKFGFESTDALWEDVQKNSLNAEVKHVLFDAATNNETSFFRDKKVFDAIHDIFNDLGREKETLKVWSAACSTGQECYSMAMTFLESRTERPNKNIFSILASDISERVLAKASKGQYTDLEVQRGLPPELKNKYFEAVAPNPAILGDTSSHWKARKELSECIHFKKINLLDHWVHSHKFDVVLCRNVLIYQNAENKKKVIQRIFDNLEPAGYLILGGAESLSGISDQFDHVPMSGVVVYRKASKI
jgi:chemotaxis protein methyltransferase CheR